MYTNFAWDISREDYGSTHIMENVVNICDFVCNKIMQTLTFSRPSLSNQHDHRFDIENTLIHLPVSPGGK